MPPKPSTAAINATTRKKIAQLNIIVSPRTRRRFGRRPEIP
jgi:hypothetical protein